jgi:hypothetical protein
MAGALIGAVRVSLSAETSAFEAGMKRSQRQAAQTASSIKGSFNSLKGALAAGVAGFIGGIGISTFIQAGKAALEYAGHIGELADTLGLTSKDLQTFSYAAGQVGISQDELQVGIQKLTVSMGQAELGAKKQINAFNAIGISVDQLKGKNAGEVFRLIAEKLENVSDRSQRAAVEVALFGKAGAKLDNLLSGSQGRLNELSDAAEKLGIVLSDEQIRKADETADKIAALQTVLKAQIAGEVADNSDAILGLANSLMSLVHVLGQAATGWRVLVAEFKAGAAALANFQNPFAAADQAADAIRAGGIAYGVGSVTMKLPTPTMKRPASSGTGSIGQFLAEKEKKKKSKEDHTAEKLAREAYELQREELDAQHNVLDAKKDLASDYVEQTTLSVQILDNEREQYKADLDYKVKQYALSKGQEGITQAQEERLLAEYDIADSLKRQKLIQDEQEQAQRDSQELTQHDFDRRRDVLESSGAIATTQAERRRIELDLLDLAYEQKRQALQNIIDTSKDQKAIEDARRDLINLKATYSNDRQNVMQRTQGPLEDYLARIPHTADQVNEALQNLEVQGLDGLADALSHVGEGWKSMRDIALQTIQDIVSALIKMQIEKMFFNLLGAASGGLGGGLGSFGGPMVLTGSLAGGASALGSVPLSGAFGALPGFDSGGSFNVMGHTGVDKNVLSLNGLQIAKVSYGERVTVGNDNMPRGGGVTVHAPITITSPVSRETAGQLGRELNARIAQARTKGF